jgi:hypothetical protein
VTLSDALVERYSRQILLPEVGGRGQERLCAARAVVVGGGPAAAYAASLLAAAGAVVAIADGAPGTLAIALDGRTAVVARVHPNGAVVVTPAGRPCAHCLPDATWGAPVGAAPASDAARDQIVGAVVAGEALRVILGLATHGRAQTVDLGAGTFAARPLPGGPGCAACAETS